MCCFSGASDTGPTGRRSRVQTQPLAFCSYCPGVAGVCLEGISLLHVRQGRGPPLAGAWSVSRDSGVATQGEVKPEGKGDLFISSRTFSGLQGCTADHVAEGWWGRPGVGGKRRW